MGIRALANKREADAPIGSPQLDAGNPSVACNAGVGCGCSAYTGHSEGAAGLSDKIAKHLAHARFEQLSSETVARTCESILDAIGVSLGATGLEPACLPFAEIAEATGGRREATLLGSRGKVPAAQAAFANGALAHALDYEDSHEPSRTHPNAATVAAALAVAEQIGAVDGRALILAVALGCDLVCRLGMAEARDGALEGNLPGFYRPAVLGTMGAAAAAGSLYGLKPEQMLDALSLSLCQNSVSAEILNSATSHVRAVREGFCAQAGVVAAQLAQRGVKGFERPLEGRDGFFTMYMGGNYSPAVVLRDLGVAFAGREIAFKAWPSCRDTHLFIQAALDLRQRHSIASKDILKIEAAIRRGALIICEPAASKRRPATAIDVKFSIYFTLATAITAGRVDLISFMPSALQDGEVLTLAQRVEYRIDPSIARPRSDGGGEFLALTLRDGSVVRQGIDQLKGSVGAPLTTIELRNKFIDCTAHAARPFPPAAAGLFADALLELPSQPNVGAMLAHHLRIQTPERA